MGVVDLEELKRRILVEFRAFELGNGPYVADGGLNEYRAGFARTNGDFSPESVVEQARTWWVHVFHGDLTNDNASVSKNTGPAWRPSRSASTRGPSIKMYSHGRMIVNFEFTDMKAGRRFNYHVPLFPLGLALQPPAQAAPAPALYGWELVNEKWVHRGAPTPPPQQPAASQPVVNVWTQKRTW